MTISNAPDSYWELDMLYQFNMKELRQHLLSLGFNKINRTASRDEMLKALHRRERGQVSYDLFSANRLLLASKSFGLQGFQHISSAKKMGPIQRQRLIEALEIADRRGRSFNRFLDLPPELRTRVYEYYVAFFPSTLQTPTKPPLALTCRLVRRELLPVFYKSIEFELPMLMLYYANETGDTSRKIIETKETQLFLLHLAPEDIACIRRLRLLIRDGRKADDLEVYACRVNLDEDGTDSCIQTAPEKQYFGRGRNPRHLLREAMIKHIDELPVTNGKKRLTLADVYKMRSLAQATLAIW